MNREELSQYRHLGNEMKMCRERIREYRTDLATYQQAAEVVQGSLPEHPYTVHSIKVQAPDCLADECRVEINALCHKIERLKRRRENIKGYIEHIRDSELRQIFMLRYVKGLSWEKIAFDMGCDGDGSTERKKHNRYLKLSRNS